MWRSALLLGIICAAGMARAQDCTALAGVIGLEIERYGDQNQVMMQRRASLCSARYEKDSSATSAQIEAAYAGFGGSAGASVEQIRERQSQECGNQFGAYWSNRVTSTDLKRVSALGARVVERCLDTSRFRLTTLNVNGPALTGTFMYGGQNQTTFSGIRIEPPSAATCNLDMVGFSTADMSAAPGQAVKSGENVTLTCRRNASSASAAARNHYEGGLLTVATGSQTVVIPLVEFSEPQVSEAAADALAARLAQTEGTLTQLTAKLADHDARLKNQLAVTVHPVTLSPEGTAGSRCTWDRSVPTPPFPPRSNMTCTYTLPPSPAGSEVVGIAVGRATGCDGCSFDVHTVTSDTIYVYRPAGPIDDGWKLVLELLVIRKSA